MRLFDKNQLILNYKKTNCIQFILKYNRDSLNLNFDIVDNIIDQANKTKCLGSS